MDRLAEISLFFETAALPKTIQLMPHIKINDVSMFIHTHLSVCQNNLNKAKFIPYYERLEVLMNKIK